MLNAYFQPTGDDHTKDVQRLFRSDRWVAAKTPASTQIHRLNTGATAILSHPSSATRTSSVSRSTASGRRSTARVTKVVAAPR
jgi:hypothetical protein